MNRAEVETIINSIREHLDELETQLGLQAAVPGSPALPGLETTGAGLIATDCPHCARLDGEPHHPACRRRLSNYRIEHLLPTGLVTHPATESCSACPQDINATAVPVS